MKKLLLILGIGLLSLTGCNQVDDNLEMIHQHEWYFLRRELVSHSQHPFEETYTYGNSGFPQKTGIHRDYGIWVDEYDYIDYYQCKNCNAQRWENVHETIIND